MNITFLTHASSHYDKQVAVLERSIKLHHPEALFLRFEPNGNADGKTYIKGLPRQRFSDVLFLLENESERLGKHDAVVLIGADCVLFNNLSHIKNLYLMEQSMKLADILMTSHINHPTDPDDGKGVNDYYKTGMINGDFVIFRNCKNTKEILRWLISQDTDTNNLSEGKFFEQTYLTALPFIFDGVEILRDDSINVAWYNLNERKLAFENDIFTVGAGDYKQPLKMFHFSGYEIDKPEQLTRYAQLNPDNTPFAVTELINWYGLELLK